jgi:hypothetical protein
MDSETLASKTERFTNDALRGMEEGSSVDVYVAGHNSNGGVNLHVHSVLLFSWEKGE